MGDYVSALATHLEDDTAVAAIADDRVHVEQVPQNTARPYVLLKVISDPRPQHLKGYDGARTSRVQADCVADRYGESRALAEVVIAAVAEPWDDGEIRFGRVKAEGPRDRGGEVEGEYRYRAVVDLIPEHREI